MRTTSAELELPFGDPNATDLAIRRLDHLLCIAGVEPTAAQRLARAFPSLSAIYAASERDLSSSVGPIAAARIRWFLDAPLNTSLVVSPLATTALRAA